MSAGLGLKKTIDYIFDHHNYWVPDSKESEVDYVKDFDIPEKTDINNTTNLDKVKEEIKEKEKKLKKVELIDNFIQRHYTNDTVRFIDTELLKNYFSFSSKDCIKFLRTKLNENDMKIIRTRLNDGYEWKSMYDAQFINVNIGVDNTADHLPE